MTSRAQSVTLSGLDFNKVYTSGEVIMLNPVESNAIFIVAAMLSASLEYLFEISGDVDSEYYQDLFEVITEESLIFGIVQLTMVFLSSLTQLSEAWAIIFQWGQLLMIYMAFWLTVFVVFVANNNMGWRAYWQTFETQRMGSGSANPTDDEKLYARCVEKFRMTMMAYGYTRDQQVHFCEYLGTIEKRLVVKLMDLSWKAWLSMVVTATVNSLRAAAVARDRHDWMGINQVIPFASYVFVQGIGPLSFFLYLRNGLRRRLQQYLDLGSEGMEKRMKQLNFNASEPDASKHHDVEPFTQSELQDPQSFLFWQSLDTTLTLVQISLLQVVWFYSNAILTLGGNGKLWVETDTMTSVVMFILLILLFAPGVVMALNLSWTVTLISIMSSLEIAADRELIDECCGITKEMRQAEADEKEAAEKKKQEEEEQRKREEEGRGAGPAPVELDEEGKVKVQMGVKRPVVLDDDLGMSRIAIDAKMVQSQYEEIEGIRL